MMDLDVDYIRECFEYDKDAGTFRWRYRPRNHFDSTHVYKSMNGRSAGKSAGFIDSSGRHRLRLDGGEYPADHIAIFYVDGVYPSFGVSFNDYDMTNIKYSNLVNEDAALFGLYPSFSKYEISLDYLNECVSYDSITGILTWKIRPRSHFTSVTMWQRFNKYFGGTVVSRLTPRGHIALKIGDYQYSGHRIVVFMQSGIMPMHDIHHINGDLSDNRLSNLVVSNKLKAGALKLSVRKKGDMT